MSSPSRPQVLVLDRNRRNRSLLDRFLSDEGYGVKTVASLEALDGEMDGDDFIVALLDVSGFGEGIWERCRRLDELDVACLVISPVELRSHVEGIALEHGAVGLLTKPLAKKTLRDAVAELAAHHE